MIAHDNPLTAEMVGVYGAKLRTLLAALDRQVVDAALVGEGKSDLLDPEREEVDRGSEFSDDRVRVALDRAPLYLRGRGLALLDSFEDELKSCLPDQIVGGA